MKTIRLYGALGKKFGREYRLDVKTPAEAIRALRAVVDGFESFLIEHKDDAFKVFVGARNTSEKEELKTPTSDKEIIRITPVIQGAGATGRIVLGAVLLIISIWFPPAGWGATAINAMGAMGASLVLGGVIELLSPAQKNESGSGESVTNTPSINFNGPVNTTAQGHPVPLAYGLVMTGSAVISAGLVTE